MFTVDLNASAAILITVMKTILEEKELYPTVGKFAYKIQSAYIHIVQLMN